MSETQATNPFTKQDREAVLHALRANPPMPSGPLPLCVERYEATVAKLESVIERERTAAVVWIERARAAVRSRRGMATSRGSYEWDDDGYRKEFAAALDDIDRALDRAEKETHARDLTDCPATQTEVEAARRSL